MRPRQNTALWAEMLDRDTAKHGLISEKQKNYEFIKISKIFMFFEIKTHHLYISIYPCP